jgi:hypothetical protein
MFEAAASGDSMTGQEGQLRRAVHQPFQRIESVDGRNLTDGIHSRVNIKRGEPFGTALDLSHAFADLISYWPERFLCHFPAPVEAIVAAKG